MAALSDNLLPTPSRARLREAFVGKSLEDVPTPAAVVDRAVVQRNCHQMLNACEALQLDFRPHVKTHKTTEVAQLQLGDVTSSANVVVSTVAEAEYLLDFLLTSREIGKHVNVLYGIPLPPSQIQRLAQLGLKLGPHSISVLVDDLSQLPAANVFKEMTGFALLIFIKVDTGYHRAGLESSTLAFKRLVQAVYELESHGLGFLAGFYSHAGHSYGIDSSLSAIKLLIEELEGLEKAATEAISLRPLASPQPHYILSAGATPTTTSIENLYGNSREPTAERLKILVGRVKEKHTVEVHAGVYPFLDMQQLATHASPSAVGLRSTISIADMALSILVEVASVYDSRDEPEALIAAGTLALGREPCKSYDGWGIVSSWGTGLNGDWIGESGWKVGRISQEHSVLTKDLDSSAGRCARLHVGQKLRIWPNHACVASAGFAWYLVVDSRLPTDKQDEVVDVWVRCRGW